MNDTVSEDVKLDEAGVEAARDAFYGGPAKDFKNPPVGALEVALRAYLAATKPASPLPGDVTVRAHKWIASPLGHGETMCVYCKGTNRELAVLGELNHCSKAPAIASPPMPGRGEGFVLVPVEPSEELWIAFSMEYAVEGYENFVKAYRALITSASRPKEDPHAE